MANNKIEFSRGDIREGIYFYLPVTSWVAGGYLFFAAKPVITDGLLDTTAVIDQVWDDTDIIGDVLDADGVLCKKYNCIFPASATNSIESGGADSLDYLAEFQYVPPSGEPLTFPPTDPKLNCVVVFDVKRETAP